MEPGRVPAVPRERSVFHDHIVGLDDGQQVKILKHYVKRHGLSLNDYFERWGLPLDYPKQCAAISERKREIAEETGLGHLRKRTPKNQRKALAPAVPIEESVTPEHIICLEDGKKVPNLKRHLRTSHNMDFDECRVRWGLPDDYPSLPEAITNKKVTTKKIMS